MSKPTAISLFAGCGGDTLGLEMAGFKVVGIVENWKPAINTHNKNFPKADLIGKEVGGDITKIPDEEFQKYKGEIDLIFAGFPCQGFSHAGKKDPNDPRNKLFWEFVRATDLIRPKWVVGENVSGLTKRKTDDGKSYVADVIVSAFEKIPNKDVSSFKMFVGSKKISKSILEKWEEKGGRVLWMEVKTAKGNVYTLNDTFPHSRTEGDEVYVFFDIKNQKIHVVTSCSIHDIYGKKFGVDMGRLSKTSKQIVGEFQSKLNSNWSGLGVHTAARPTYRIDLELAHVDEIDSNKVSAYLEDLFKKCGLV